MNVEALQAAGMQEAVLVSQVHWVWLTELRDLSNFGWPFVMLAASAVWACRKPSVLSRMALLGAMLALSGWIVHWYELGVATVSLGKEVQPAPEANVLIYFIQDFGEPIGRLLLAVSLLCYFARKGGRA